MISKLERFCQLKHQTKRNIKNKYSSLVYIIMDNLVAEASDVMSPALDFGLPKTAQYVRDRRHVNFFPSGSNIYTSATGNKNIRFYVSCEDGTYLDLSSIRMFANLQYDGDTDAQFLRPLTGLHDFLIAIVVP